MSSILLVFLIFQFFVGIKVDGRSNIKLGSSLVAGAKSTNAWYSHSKMFAFGFYQQGSRYVVAIWLESSGENIVVWTAYRDDPPVSPNATLTLTRQGEFVLSCDHAGGESKKTIAANVSSAVMNNTGNFILYDDRMGIVWQSFDYPTDSLLNGQSLFPGSQLVSSVSKTNYSSGRYRIKMQIDNNLVTLPMNMEEYSESCYWSSHTYVLQTTTSNSSLYLSSTGLRLINRNTSEILVLYTENRNPYDPYYSFLYRATLGDDGIFRLYAYRQHANNPPPIIWKAPDSPCDVKNFCGFNSYCIINDHEQPDCVCLPGCDFVHPDLKSRGCERNFTKAMCKSGIENVTYYIMAPKERLVCEDWPYIKVSGDKKKDCWDSCLEDCECDAASFKDKICTKHKFPLRYMKRVSEVSTNIMFFKMPNVSLNVQANESFNGSAVEVQVQQRAEKTWLIILVMGVGFSMYSCISLSLTVYFVFKYHLLKYKRLLDSTSLGVAHDLILQSYTYRELKRATDGFKHELGRGSFGKVYKGRFYKGNKVIAVKRLEKVVDEGEREFRAEMQVIGKTHHKNLVRLLGFCAEGKTERLLVYEYMSNGTLADRLFRSDRLPDWSERVQIAMDVARGILYLHEECETPIIHCDIKPANILMDDFWTAKISDFGLAKLLTPDQTKTFTIVRGTRGYLAPEWQKNTPISVKVDIFSYGIVLLETICCRRNLDITVSNTEEIILSNWVYKCFERGQMDLLVGGEQVDMETLERLVKIGLWCIQDEPVHRPSMKSVLLMLEGITEIATPPCPTSIW